MLWCTRFIVQSTMESQCVIGIYYFLGKFIFSYTGQMNPHHSSRSVDQGVDIHPLPQQDSHWFSSTTRLFWVFLVCSRYKLLTHFAYINPRHSPKENSEVFSSSRNQVAGNHRLHCMSLPLFIYYTSSLLCGVTPGAPLSVHHVAHSFKSTLTIKVVTGLWSFWCFL